MSKDAKSGDAAEATAATGVNVAWDDSEMASSYANIATATATREEFFLLFGLHQNWKGMPEGGQLDVKLNDRIVLNPHAAKRLAAVLMGAVKQYEERFGEIGS